MARRTLTGGHRTPLDPVAALRGIVRPRRHQVTTEAMNEAIGAGATQGSLRRKRR
jgi:hypothetical protein